MTRREKDKLIAEHQIRIDELEAEKMMVTEFIEIIDLDNQISRLEQEIEDINNELEL